MRCIYGIKTSPHDLPSDLGNCSSGRNYQIPGKP